MRYLVLPALSVLWLTSSVGAQEPFRAVLDHAGLFNDRTLLDADRQLLDLLRRRHFHVVVETFEAVPEKDRSRVHQMNQTDVLQYLREWAGQRAREEKVDGLYILICRNPGHVGVLPWPASHDAAFSDDECEHLRKTFVDTEKRKKANAALLALVKAVGDHLDHPVTRAEEPNLAWTTVLAIVAGGVLTWLILCLFRLRLNSRFGDVPDERDQLFKPALYGGMFGTLAGHWVYDTLFRAFDRLSEPPPSSTETAPVETGEPTGEPAPEETSATGTES